MFPVHAQLEQPWRCFVIAPPEMRGIARVVSERRFGDLVLSYTVAYPDGVTAVAMPGCVADGERVVQFRSRAELQPRLFA